MFRIAGFPRKDLKWWLQNEKFVDFDPDFQRTSRVWNDRDKAFLIDSILNGFDIPKLYIADFSKYNIPALNRHKKRYAIIDGKQRLTAIISFFRDGFPLHKNFVLESDPMLNLGKLRFSELQKQHPEVARALERHSLDVKVIETDDRRKINDVFLRLNKSSKALNGAEVRNAMIGQAVDAIRDLAKDRFFLRKIRFSTDRSQEKNAAAKILALEYEGSPVETKKKNLDQFVISIGENGGGRFNRTLRRVRSNLNTLFSSFRDQDPLLSNQGSLPLYYMFISRLKSSDRSMAHAFLVFFDRQIIRNRNLSGNARDHELDTYDFAGRSTNDKQSFEARLRIVRAKFAAWKRTSQ